MGLTGSPAPAGMVPSREPLGYPPPWFPRTRGDGPYKWAQPPLPLPVPPHPRGWSRCPPLGSRPYAGSPAPAGMVPPGTGRPTLAARFPRTRGDGPLASGEGSIRFSVPPHPRGWSPAAIAPEKEATGSPAPAGMVPARGRGRGADDRFPRTRGDGPCETLTIPISCWVPPHPRGWSLTTRPRSRRSRGSPAPAGMVPHWQCHRTGQHRFPRTRGDGPVAGRIVRGQR